MDLQRQKLEQQQEQSSVDEQAQPLAEQANAQSTTTPPCINVNSTPSISAFLGELLLDDNYSIERLLEFARQKDLNLRELRDHLQEHQLELHQTSLELFDKSYDKFLKVSQLVGCLDEPINQLVSPIQNYHSQLSGLQQSHREYLQQIDEKISKLEETNKDSLLAEQLVALVRRCDRIFEQVNQNEWFKCVNLDLVFGGRQQLRGQRDKPPIYFKVNCDTIERLSDELFYLACEICAIQPSSDELKLIKKTLDSNVREQARLVGNWFVDAKAYLEESSLESPLKDYADKCITRALSKYDTPSATANKNVTINDG